MVNVIGLRHRYPPFEDWRSFVLVVAVMSGQAVLDQDKQ